VPIFEEICHAPVGLGIHDVTIRCDGTTGVFRLRGAYSSSADRAADAHSRVPAERVRRLAACALILEAGGSNEAAKSTLIQIGDRLLL